MIELKIRIAELIVSAWRRRWVIFLPSLILPIVAVSVAQLAPTQYKAHTSMLIQETAKMNPFLQDLAVSTGLNDRFSAVQTLLKSRHVLSLVAQELALVDDSSSDYEKDQIMAKIAMNLRVIQQGKDLLKIEYSARSPEGMKELLESVSYHFIEQLLAPERSSIRDSSTFLTEHINKRFEELQLAEQKLADYTNIHSSLTPEIQSQSYARIAVLKQSLAEKEAELFGVKRSLGSLDQQLSSTNPVVGRIEDKIIEIRSQLTLLQARYTQNHSSVQAKQRELNRLEQEREVLLNSNQPSLNTDQLRNMASSQSINNIASIQPLLMSQLQNLQQIRSRFEALTEETDRLRSMIQELETKTQGYGDNVKEIYSLKREVEMKRQLYEELVQRYEMAQLTGALGVFEENKRVKIIDLPFTPSSPSNWPMFIYLIIGLIGGLGLGTGIAIILELFDTTIRNEADVKSVTSIPIMVISPASH
ncbi:Wzz/FepE/Etk N-terminal domain-containing protein [Vibrio sp. B1Z05]|uniref:GumC family protein n=1 Tax=Vibrio sp. B1Z05 TaxID=2654980 RepID=UPI00128D1C66|nr:Wzz/FepE/Etk N-terminal domain-containing protein [Vibrio sp. B1Z05]MPW36441.1 chain-length determining protein [Vibrio sp. B1Z05]